MKDKEKQDIINIQEEEKINIEENKDIKNNEAKKDNNENIILNEDINLKENKDNKGYNENNKKIINDKNDEGKTKEDKNKSNGNMMKDYANVDNMEDIKQLNKKEKNMEKRQKGRTFGPVKCDGLWRIPSTKRRSGRYSRASIWFSGRG